MKITRIRAYRVELPLARRELQVVRRQVGLGVRQHDRGGRDRRGRHRLRRGLSARAVLPAGLCRGVRAGIAELGPHLLGEDPTAARQAQPPHGRRPPGPSLREVGDRHGLLGHPRQGDRPAGVRAPGRPLRRRLRPLSRHLARIARGDGRARGRLSRRGLSPVSAQGRRRSRWSTSTAFARSPPSSSPAIA